jgi:hypothetical protein
MGLGAAAVAAAAVVLIRPAPPPAAAAPPPSPPPPAPVKAPPPPVLAPRESTAPKDADLWARLESRAAPLISAEEFRAAADVFEGARGTSGPSIDAAVDRRAAELRGKAEALLPSVQGQAAAETRVRRWGYPDLVERFRSSLAAPAEAPKATAEPPKAPSSEAVAYAARWTSAMRLASRRRFDEAIAELEAARQGLTETAAEAAADLALLRELKALHEAGLKAFAERAPGGALTLRVWSAEGAALELAGVVRRAGPKRLELEGGDPPGPIYVEASDLTSHALAALAGATPRAAAAAALLDGDAVSTADGLPAKYADWAREAAALRPRPDAAELAVRARFYEAERSFAREDQRARAARLYRDLLREHADAPLVRDELPRIRSRGEVPKEIFLGVLDLGSGGGFRLSAVEKAESSWVCVEAGPPEATASNFVELSFTAVPELSYKLWVHVGGCCAETFTFGMQADELLVKSTTVPVGGPTWAPVSHGILYLKRAHSMHNGPREPKRWEWVPLALPKYSTPGVKRVRLVTGQIGFGVAAAFLSAARSAPPGEAETRDKLRASAPPMKPTDEILAGAWKMDEGRGRVAVDASGRGQHGTLAGAEWRLADGRAGLWFDGVDDALVGPTKALDGVEDTFTIAFWARPEGERTSTPEEASGVSGTKEQRYAVYPTHGQDTGRAGLGVSVGRNGVSVFEHASGHMPSLLVHDAPINGWVHVVVVVERRQPRLYLDGVLARTGVASARPVFAGGQVSPSDYGRYAGLLADLRIYKRALSEEDLRKLRR